MNNSPFGSIFGLETNEVLATSDTGLGFISPDMLKLTGPSAAAGVDDILRVVIKWTDVEDSFAPVVLAMVYSSPKMLPECQLSSITPVVRALPNLSLETALILNTDCAHIPARVPVSLIKIIQKILNYRLKVLLPRR